jgi:hypothetical protein
VSSPTPQSAWKAGLTAGRPGRAWGPHGECRRLREVAAGASRRRSQDSARPPRNAGELFRDSGLGVRRGYSAFPSSMPMANTSTPPTTTWIRVRPSGLCM